MHDPANPLDSLTLWARHPCFLALHSIDILVTCQWPPLRPGRRDYEPRLHDSQFNISSAPNALQSLKLFSPVIYPKLLGGSWSTLTSLSLGSWAPFMPVQLAPLVGQLPNVTTLVLSVCTTEHTHSSLSTAGALIGSLPRLTTLSLCQLWPCHLQLLLSQLSPNQALESINTSLWTPSPLTTPTRSSSPYPYYHRRPVASPPLQSHSQTCASSPVRWLVPVQASAQLPGLRFVNAWRFSLHCLSEDITRQVPAEFYPTWTSQPPGWDRFLAQLKSQSIVLELGPIVLW